ncbi:hypothetical protein [Novosphingobium sp.]|uniref:phenylacetate--CoA ligase family protein n=1 Tax=Novosphingobium sp. TaxID=1874826 RepID=UPI003342D39A
MQFRSAIPAATFPAILTGRAAELMALQRQYDESQFWPIEQMQSVQFTQLSALLDHCAHNVPFYAKRLRSVGIDPARPITAQDWRRMPILTRVDVQELGDRLHARAIPPGFGQVSTIASGGSTGVPVRVRKTAVDGLLWESINIREELWHRDRPDADMVRLRGVPDGLPAEMAAAARSSDGLILPDYGHPSVQLWKTGRLGVLSPKVPVADQVAFLNKLQPGYMMIFPSYLRLLISFIRDTGTPISPMRAVFTMSEQVSDELREDCQSVFGCKIVDNYSSAETGYIALQCPQTTNLHVQSEIVLTEVLNSDGMPCQPGEIGKVVLTPLHNFAMPLLRYAIGDEAEVAEPCACGRGLQTLKRIVGREEDYLVYPNGERTRAHLSHYRLSRIPPVREFRLVQRSHTELVLQLVVSRALTDGERSEIMAIMALASGGHFATDIEIVPELDRTAVGKLRAFKSEITR